MTADDFFRYVEAYWAHAEQHGGSRPAPGVLQMLRATRDSHVGVGKRPGDISARTHRPYRSGYLSGQRLLWIRRPELTRLAKAIGKKEYARDFVDEDDPFIHRTTTFAISGDVASFCQRGVVLVGRSEARTGNDILWIGITTDRALAYLDLAERAARLRTPMSRYPARERLPWANHADVVGSIAVANAADVRQATRELFAMDLVTVNDHIDLLHEGGLEPQLLCHAPDGIHELKQAFEEHGELPVIVAGRDIFDELRTIAFTLAGTNSTLSGVPVVILDRERLADELSHRPWLWSKHFGNDNGIQIIAPGDDVRLRTVTLTGPFADVPPVSAALRSNLRSALNTSARIIGEPGSGKTTAIVSLLERNEQPVVWVSGGYRDDELLVSLVHDLNNVVVVLDDFGWQRDVPEHQSPLARITRLQRGGASIRMILSYWTSEAAEVEKQYAHTFYDAQLPEPINLDHPDRGFLASVARAATRSWHITADELAIERTIEFVKRGPDTPHALVTYLRSFAGSALRVPAAIEVFVRWQDRLTALARSSAIPDQRRLTLLNVLSMLRLFDFHGVPVRLVEECFAAIGGTEFATALAALQEEFWVVLRKNMVFADDAQLDLRYVGFLLFTGELRTVATVVVNRPELLSRARRRILLRALAAGKLAAGFTAIRLSDDTSALARSAWRAEFPDDVVPLDA